MEARVYIETTIPSFYHELRSEPEMVALRNWTREWWDGHRGRYEVVTSEATLDELSEGDYPTKDECLALVAALPLLAVEAEIAEIVESYVERHVMPADPVGDALHLALASFHRCDFLLTWNCNHLANANKFGHIRRVNTVLGLFIPQIVTPLELMGGDES